MDLQLKGKRALITGGSRGLGLAIAKVLAAEGVACAITARSVETLEKAALDITAESAGSTVVPIACDVTNTVSVAHMVDEVTRQLGGIDIAVNSAARVAGGDPDTLDGVTEEMMFNDFDTKVVGYFRVARAVAPAMRSQGWGRIINISGTSARRGGSVASGTRNAAVVNLTKTLSLELAQNGITVNAIYPALTLTEVVRERYEQRALELGVSFEEASADDVAAVSGINRFIEPAEIGVLAAFLASPIAAAISGEVIAVTGGAGRYVYY
jgi:NAD(P)-dependent dehydrogenase (short-subunit alcohol dehydrogenase family)